MMSRNIRVNYRFDKECTVLRVFFKKLTEPESIVKFAM
jgi:hypothetical protein